MASLQYVIFRSPGEAILTLNSSFVMLCNELNIAQSET